MAWNGYYELGGVELVNATRTEAYVRAAGIYTFHPLYEAESLPLVLGDGEYHTPLHDDPVWADPDVPESYDFFGFYPLGVSGIEDSTGDAPVTESTIDGGTVGATRYSTRSVVFNGLLLASSECGVEYGMRWLKRALSGLPCGPGKRCEGAELSYFACEPVVDMTFGDMTAEELLACTEQRTLRQFGVTRRPSVTAKRSTTDGLYLWAVQFTGTSGLPWEYGAPATIFEAFPVDTTPYMPGITGGVANTAGYAHTDTPCAAPVWDPLYDPLCAALVAPPAPPDIALGCYVPLGQWWRRTISVPGQYIPYWGDVVPIIEIHAPPVADVRDLRIRFYPDEVGAGDPDDSSCDYLADLIVSYVPQGFTLIFDAVERTVRVFNPATGQLRNADTLVFRSDGKPFDWPAFGCGYGYVVTFDMPTAADPPSIDMSLVPRVSA